MSKNIRVLLAKPGLDGHDRGIKVIAAALRDAGMEVVYTGLRQTPDMIVEAAVQEDVQFIGMSGLSGAHMTLFPEVLKLLKEKGAGSIHLFGGGIIPGTEAAELEKTGVGKLFGPGTTTNEIVTYIHSVASDRTEEPIM